MRRIVRISTTFAVAVAAYWAYALVVVPRIEPPAVPRVPGSAAPGTSLPIDPLGGLRGLFRPGDWELNEDTKVLKSNQATLLLQDYTNEPGSSTVELRPCTIIFTPNGASANEEERTREAIVLQSDKDKGAVLEFDREFDLRRGSIGRLVSGRLNGRIVIRSQWKSPGPEDDLYAVTSDVQLTEQRIWVPNALDFSLGRSTGRGSEMQIKFVPGDDPEGASRHGLNIAGVESVEVRRLERLHLEPVSKKAGREKPPIAGPGTVDSDLPIEITCRGPFRFDMGGQVATFEDHVDLFRLHPNGPSDQLNCQVLTVQFARRREAEGPSGSDPKAVSKDRSGLPNLEARRIEARGNPAVLRAPSQGAEARGERLQYDLQESWVALEGGQEVYLKQGANEVHARRIEYHVAGPGQLGQVLAEGPGWFRGRMSNQPGQPLEAQWKGELRVRPDEQQQHLISLVGDAELNYGALGRLGAGEIHFWLNEVPLPAASPDNGGQRFSVQLDRMLARNQVRLRAAQLTGAVNQLEVWFEPAPTTTPPRAAHPRGGTASQKASGPAHPALQLARQFPKMARTAWRLAADDDPLTRLLVSGAVAGAAAPGAAVASPAGGPPTGVALGRKFDIQGSLLRARVAGLGEHAEISELIVEGNVRFVETQTAQPGEKPLAVTGDRIHVVDAGKPHVAVGVTGNPARFEGRGLTLSGSNINLNAGTNRLWIDGPGQIEILMDRDLEGRPAADQGPLVIQWQRSMDLKDRTVRFEESVVATSRQQQLRTETLEAVFHEPVRFSDTKQASKPEIDAVVCRGRVLVEGREFEGTKQTSTEQIDVTDLTLNRVSGAIRALGPGRVISVRVQSPQTPPLVPDALAPSSAGGDPSKPLVCLDIRFQRELTGNLRNRQMVFHEQVRTLYAPVASWDAKLDPDNPDSLGPNGVELRCDQLAATQLSVPGSQARAWALEATGNTRAEGQTYTAQGTRMTYDQAKGLLILEGDGRSDATLYLQDHPNQPRTSQQSRRILFWPATKRVSLEGFRSLDIPSLPSGGKADRGKGAPLK